MGFVDQIMVGQLGEDVISAVGNSAQLSMFFFMLFAAIGQGGSILISQYYGGKEFDKLKKCISSIIFLGFIIGALFSLIYFFFGGHLVYYVLTLGKWKNVSIIAGEYLKIVSFSYLLVIPGNMIVGALKSMGDTKTPVKISIITNILNIIGNYILIFGIGPFPELGYKGAAISTLISSLIQGLALIIVILKRSNAIKLSFLDLFKPDFTQIKKIIGVGYPMSIDGFYWQGARMFYTMVFNFISSGAYAAYSIVKNFKGMAFLPASGLAQGIMISVGHNLGKRKMKNAVLFAKLGIKIGLLIITIPSLILIIFSYNLINIYKVQPDTFFTAWICVLILGVSLYFTVLNSIIPGVLRAGGQTKSVMLITLISFIAVGAPLSLILGVFLKFGAIGAFVGITIEEIIKSFIFYRQLKKYLWLKKLN